MGYTPPWFNLTKVGINTSLKPVGVTGDFLNIYANSVDTKPCIALEGAGSISLISAGAVYFTDTAGNNFVRIIFSTPDIVIEGDAGEANANIFLKPNGTGKLKFGTFTGSGDVAVNGSIAILDSSGNARKLATVA